MLRRTKLNKIITILTVFLLLGIMMGGIGCVDNNNANTSANNTGTDASESITIKGSDTVLPLAQAEAEDFMIKYPNKKITVIGGGSGVGIAALIDKEIPVAMASREMKQEEIDNARQNGIDPIETPIAWDGIAVVVNPQNPVNQLTYDQLKMIYNGNISNWKDVGGNDEQITVISRDTSSGTYEYFKEEILGDENYRQDALIQPATGAIVKEISQNTGAVGYIGHAYLNDDIKGVQLNNGTSGFVSPEQQNILDGKYPLARKLYFYTNGQPGNLTKEFIDYINSEEGKATTTEVGYFPY